MEVLGDVILPKRGLHSVLSLIDNETNEMELVAIAWVDWNRHFFVTPTCRLDEGKMIGPAQAPSPARQVRPSAAGQGHHQGRPAKCDRQVLRWRWHHRLALPRG